MAPVMHIAAAMLTRSPHEFEFYQQGGRRRRPPFWKRHGAVLLGLRAGSMLLLEVVFIIFLR